MFQLVSELLELSRIESGQVPLKIKPVHVSEELIAPPVERLTAQADRNGLPWLPNCLMTYPRSLPTQNASSKS